MLSSFFELYRQKYVQRKHPQLLQLRAVIGTEKGMANIKKNLDIFFPYWDVHKG
jgi:hypothetical protein